MLRWSVDDIAISHKNNAIIKMQTSKFFQTPFLLRFPLRSWLLLQGEDITKKSNPWKTTTLSCTIRGHHQCNYRKSHLGWAASFVPNQRLPYKLVDLITFILLHNKNLQFWFKKQNFTIAYQNFSLFRHGKHGKQGTSETNLTQAFIVFHIMFHIYVTAFRIIFDQKEKALIFFFESLWLRLLPKLKSA